MLALMEDVALGKVTPATCNAQCNAASKVLKLVELREKYHIGQDLSLLEDSEK